MAEILDLSTKRDRPRIRIDGVLYDLMLPSDMELKDVLWIQKAGARIEKLQSVFKEDDEHDEDIAEEFERTLRRLADLVLAEVPKEKRDRLNDVQRLTVVDTYNRLVEKEKDSFFDPGVAPARDENGSKSSQASNDSTEETSKVG